MKEPQITGMFFTGLRIGVDVSGVSCKGGKDETTILNLR